MFRMPQQRWKRSALLVCGGLLGLAPLVYAQAQAHEEAPAPAVGSKPEKNTRTEAERRAWKAQQLQGSNQILLTCMLARVGQVHRFAITCPTTRHLDAKIADCCVAGDHWQVKVKSWDFKPNAGLTTSPGGAGDYGAPARVYSYSTSRDLHAMIECTYLHGATTFPAEADILVDTGSPNCTVEDLGVSHEIPERL